MSDLYKVLVEVEDAVLVAASSLGVEIPERRVITMGGAAYDCEQLAVSGMTGVPGIPGSETTASGIIANCPPGAWMAEVEVALVRKSCSGVAAIPGRRGNGVPDASSYGKEAEMVSDDFDLLRAAANSLAGGSENQFGSVTASIVMGQAQGGRIASVLSLGIAIWAPRTGE